MEKADEKPRRGSIKIILIFITIFIISLNFLYINRAVSYTNYLRIRANSGGASIYANLYLPSRSLPFQEKHPLIIYCHGLAGQRDIDLRIPIELTKRGFFVAALDYQGHGESGGYVLNLNSEKTMPAIAQDCSKILDVIETMEIYNQINSSQIGLVGHSLGGMVVLMNGALDDRFKATVTWAGLVNFDLEKLGLADNGTYAKFLPVNIINETNPANLLMIHHQADPIVPYETNAVLAQNLTNCELITIKGNLIGGPHFLMTDETLIETINWFETKFFGSEIINGPIIFSFLLNYIFLFISLAAMFGTILAMINYFGSFFKFPNNLQEEDNESYEAVSKKVKRNRILRILFYYSLFIFIWVIFYVYFDILGLFVGALIFFLSYSIWNFVQFQQEKTQSITKRYLLKKVKEQLNMNEIGYAILSSAIFLGFYLLFTISYPFGFVFPSSFLSFVIASAGLPIYLSLELFFRKIITPLLDFIKKEKNRTTFIIISAIAVQILLYVFTWNWSILPGVLTTHIILATVIIINTFIYSKTKNFSSVFIVSYLIIQIFFGAGISQVLGIRNLLTYFI